MKNNSVERILNLIFTSSILLGMYSIVKTYYFDRRNLPEGVCPITNNRALLVLSIGILILYMILSTIYEKKRDVL